MREEINEMDKNIFIIIFIITLKKNGLVDRGTQHISLFALKRFNMLRGLRH